MMTDFFRYSLETAVCLGVLYLPYRLVFRSMTFNQGNRFYLLGAIAFSLLAPLGNFALTEPWHPLNESLQSVTKPPQEFFEENLLSVEVKTPISASSETVSQKPVVTEAISPAKPFNWWRIGYLSGLAVSFTLLGIRLGKLGGMLRAGNLIRHPDYIEAHVPGLGKKVFSFFHFVFIDRKQFSEQELSMLLAHEHTHMKEGHSFDLLLMEILQCIFWFNPMFWLYRRALQNEHEYFTDTQIAAQVGKKAYAQSLLDLAVKKRPILGHAFAYVPIRHRILKLSQKPSDTMTQTRYFSALPLFGLLFLLFACSDDPLEALESAPNPQGQLVQKVTAFYEPYSADLMEGSGEELGTVEFDKNGLYVNYNGKRHPVFNSGKVFSEVTNPQNGDLLSHLNLQHNFLARQVQWLIGDDPYLNLNHLREILMFSEQFSGLIEIQNVGVHGHKLINTRIDTTKPGGKGYGYLIGEKGTLGNVTIQKSGENIMGLNQEYLYEHGRLVSNQKISYNADDALTFWESTTEFLPNAGWQKPPIKSGVHPRKESVTLIAEYDHNTQLKSLKRDDLRTAKYPIDFVVGRPVEIYESHSQNNLELQFTHNEQGLIATMSIYKEGKLLRSYEYSYNTQGLCTKQVMVNRFGEREFGIRYEYAFFEKI